MKKTITFLLRIVAIVLLLIVVIESAFSQSGLPSLDHPLLLTITLRLSYR